MATVPLAITAVIGQIVNAVCIPIHAGEQGRQADRLKNLPFIDTRTVTMNWPDLRLIQCLYIRP
jgi:hypothetical protein